MDTVYRRIGSALLVGLLTGATFGCSSSSSPGVGGSGGMGGGGSGGSGSGGTGPALDQRTMDLLARATGKTKPIADTHIHIFQPSRSGVAWPPAANTTIYKDWLPDAYMAMAMPLGILGSGIVEASPWIDDTQWVLAQAAKTPASKAFFPWYVAQLDMSSADFIKNLTAYTTVDAMNNPDADKVVGLRVYLWSAKIDLTNDIQKANLAEVQKRGMTLDIISRGTGATETNPKAQVVALATAYPGIRIIIDHMAGAKIDTTAAPTWMADIATLKPLTNVYVKWSAFFDAANPTGDESKPWTAPKDMMSYKAIFDALFAAFGPDRIIWGSNYPVSELGEPAGAPLGQSIIDELKIAEDYLATQAAGVRDKVMFDNAANFYRRIPMGTTPGTSPLLALKTGKTKPVLDTHIHVFQPSRPGVVYPDSANTTLYHDFLPKTCTAMSMKATCGPTYADEIKNVNILATGVVEASPRNNDNTGTYDTDWVLSQLKGNDQFFNYTAQLDISSKDFITNLDLNTKGMTADGVDRAVMIAGLRVYLWSAAIDPADPVQAANLAEVQKRGMTLDIISRGKPPTEKNPKDQVVALATAFPKIRIIIDHMAGAKLDSASPDPRWMADIAKLAAKPNIYVKWSAFFDTANASGDESMPWTAPKDAASYTKIFDALWTTFGEDRIIWGSNWPVAKLAGSLEEEVKIAEDYLATKTPAQRDKVMFKNAILFYRRVPPQ
ncbi:MAG TPA: amidohydrolase family protein [Polyangia bacterium]|nr:amidohydrolase family protein [Polyangia bacterium]